MRLAPLFASGLLYMCQMEISLCIPLSTLLSYIIDGTSRLRLDLSLSENGFVAILGKTKLNSPFNISENRSNDPFSKMFLCYHIVLPASNLSYCPSKVL